MPSNHSHESASSPAGRAAAAATAASDPLFLGTLGKAVRVLDAFCAAPHAALGLGEVADLSGLDRSAAQRIVHTLVALGWLERDTRTRQVALTPRVLDLAFAYLSRSRLVEVATANLLELQRRSRERVNLAVLDGTTIIYLLRLQVRREAFVTTLVGRRLPAYCTAAGRAMLAHLPPDEARARLAASDRTAQTPYTVTEVEALMADLDEARRCGFAVQAQQYRHGEIGLAVPVLDAEGRPLAAVSLISHLDAWDPEAFARRFTPLVTETARRIAQDQILPE
ncbi:hypothetical protein AY600_08820 [Phormidium willei BDU 130791]|nr:hypothetical protein AY600_08820 [Phormidium willei BDU 130791]